MRGRAIALIALGLPACAATAPHAPLPRLTALGTEPFWQFSLENGRLSYTTPETHEPRSTPVTGRTDQGTTEISGSFAGKPLQATIRREACSDGMSDRSYPMSVTMTIAGREQRGCAYPTDRPPPAD